MNETRTETVVPGGEVCKTLHYCRVASGGQQYDDPDPGRRR
jgi:hypothetical protein